MKNYINICLIFLFLGFAQRLDALGGSQSDRSKQSFLERLMQIFQSNPEGASKRVEQPFVSESSRTSKGSQPLRLSESSELTEPLSTRFKRAMGSLFGQGKSGESKAQSVPEAEKTGSVSEAASARQRTSKSWKEKLYPERLVTRFKNIKNFPAKVAQLRESRLIVDNSTEIKAFKAYFDDLQNGGLYEFLSNWLVAIYEGQALLAEQLYKELQKMLNRSDDESLQSIVSALQAYAKNEYRGEDFTVESWDAEKVVLEDFFKKSVKQITEKIIGDIDRIRDGRVSGDTEKKIVALVEQRRPWWRPFAQRDIVPLEPPIQEEASLLKEEPSSQRSTEAEKVVADVGVQTDFSLEAHQEIEELRKALALATHLPESESESESESDPKAQIGQPTLIGSGLTGSQKFPIELRGLVSREQKQLSRPTVEFVKNLFGVQSRLAFQGQDIFVTMGFDMNQIIEKLGLGSVMTAQSFGSNIDLVAVPQGTAGRLKLLTGSASKEGVPEITVVVPKGSMQPGIYTMTIEGKKYVFKVVDLDEQAIEKSLRPILGQPKTLPAIKQPESGSNLPKGKKFRKRGKRGISTKGAENVSLPESETESEPKAEQPERLPLIKYRFFGSRKKTTPEAFQPLPEESFKELIKKRATKDKETLNSFLDAYEKDFNYKPLDAKKTGVQWYASVLNQGKSFLSKEELAQRKENLNEMERQVAEEEKVLAEEKALGRSWEVRHLIHIPRQ